MLHVTGYCFLGNGTLYSMQFNYNNVFPMQVFKVIKLLLVKLEKASEDPESAVNQAGKLTCTSSYTARPSLVLFLFHCVDRSKGTDSQFNIVFKVQQILFCSAQDM